MASAHMGGVFEAGALLSLGRTGWRVVSAPGTTAHLIEQIHTDLNAGPAMGAANAQRTMRVSDLAVETRWPRFTSAAVAQRKYGIELRKSAYSMPDGVGEHDLLYLSEQLISAADAADKP